MIAPTSTTRKDKHEDPHPHTAARLHRRQRDRHRPRRHRQRSVHPTHHHLPRAQQHLFTPEGKLRSFVNVYLNDDDIRYLPAKEDSAVTDTDELTIIPSIAGGC